MLCQLISTPVGELRAMWGPTGRLQSCTFAESTSANDSYGNQDSCGTSDSHYQPVDPRPQQLLADRLELYFRSGELAWDLDLLDWTAISAFHQRVLRNCYDIPAGATLSYAGLAAQTGSPRAARAVGSAMARNRWPLIIPCHRVVGARGQMTGYSGAGGIETKRWLLDFESQSSALNS